MRSLILLSVLVVLPMTAQAAVGIPCASVTAGESKFMAVATELATAVKIDRAVKGCRIPRGDWPMLVFKTGIGSQGSLVFAFSEEVEGLSRDAMKGLAVHEIVHLANSDHDNAFWSTLTPEQRLDREALADVTAATLVGPDIIRRAMDEYQSLFQVMARHADDVMKAEFGLRRARLAKTSRR